MVLPTAISLLVWRKVEAEKFYRDLAAQGMKVRVGMEASGHARWFERLLAELQFELWIGDAADTSCPAPQSAICSRTPETPGAILSDCPERRDRIAAQPGEPRDAWGSP